MERKQNIRSDVQPEGGKAKLARRYGEIGISAVKAAALQYRAKETLNPEASNMTSKQQSTSGREKKFNLGQLEASQEKQKDEDLRHMGELSKKGEQEPTSLKRQPRAEQTRGRRSRPGRGGS